MKPRVFLASGNPPIHSESEVVSMNHSRDAGTGGYPESERAGALECMLRVSFPPDITPGPIASIVLDKSGNIYCSDEMNHRVLSLDPGDRIRWTLHSRGNSEGSFWYPKGMSLGLLGHSEGASQCLGVADSWNRRVQFFGLDGRYAGCWNSAGGIDFGEVADVRFVSQPAAGGPRGRYWLVLDRGNHRLCAIDTEGRLLFQLGKCLPSYLEGRWAGKILSDYFDALGYGCEAPELFAPLYYPMRILGRTEEALYIWEANPGNLKQVVNGNLFKLSLTAQPHSSFLSADKFGILSWDPVTRLLGSFRSSGLFETTHVPNGEPIPSEFGSNEVWIQESGKLGLFEWKGLSDTATGSDTSQYIPPLHNLVASGLNRALKSRDLRGQIETLAACALKYPELSQRALALTRVDSGKPASLERLLAEVIQLHGDLSGASSAVKVTILENAQLLLALLYLASARSTNDKEPRLESMTDLFRKLVEPLQGAFQELNRSADDLHLRASDLAPSGDPNRTADPGASSELIGIGHYFSSALGEIIGWVRILMRFGHSPTLASESVLTENVGIASAPDRVPGTRSTRGCGLRETDRIPVQIGREGSTSNPFGLTRDPAGHLYVSLTNADCVLRLDEQGRMIECIPDPDLTVARLTKPAGIATAADGKIWVAEFLSHRFWIYDPHTRAIGHFYGKLQSEGPFRYPHGCCAGPDGSMLIADTVNNRVIQYSETHDVSICGRTGNTAVELRHPIAIFTGPGGAGDSLWVVDQRNHRLQNLDYTGILIRSIGGPGIGKGSLLLPEAAAFLPDGSIIVSQRRLCNGLKCFSVDGRELWQMPLDYGPGGMLLHNGLLLVTEADGGHIRVYELP